MMMMMMMLVINFDLRKEVKALKTFHTKVIDKFTFVQEIHEEN